MLCHSAQPSERESASATIFRPVDRIKDLAKFDPPDRDLSWRADGETLTLAKISAQSIS
jgi:hypothetical protein